MNAKELVEPPEVPLLYPAEKRKLNFVFSANRRKVFL